MELEITAQACNSLGIMVMTLAGITLENIGDNTCSTKSVAECCVTSCMVNILGVLFEGILLHNLAWNDICLEPVRFCERQKQWSDGGFNRPEHHLAHAYHSCPSLELSKVENKART